MIEVVDGMGLSSKRGFITGGRHVQSTVRVLGSDTSKLAGLIGTCKVRYPRVSYEYLEDKLPGCAAGIRYLNLP